MRLLRSRLSRGFAALLGVLLAGGLAVGICKLPRSAPMLSAARQPTDSQSNSVPAAPPQPPVESTTPVVSATAGPTTVPAILPATQPALVLPMPHITAPEPTTRGARAGDSVVPFVLPAPPPVLTLNAEAAHSGSGAAADAGAKAISGDLLGARKVLNDALVGGHLSIADAEAARAQIAEINQTVIFSTQKFSGDEYGGVYVVQPGEMLRRIALNNDVTWEFLCRINGMNDARRMRYGMPLKIIKGPFTAVVSKKDFTLDFYLGNTPGQPGSMYVCRFPVGLGREDSTTPAGTWMCELHRKLKDPTYYSPRGEGIIAGGDAKNPLGHRWIGLTGIDGQAVGQQSYGIHGTIDDESIGKLASLGCIRMHNTDVELVYDMLVEGKSIIVVKAE
jgi:hypothetical protein